MFGKRTESLNMRVAIYILSIPVLLLYTLALNGCVSTSPGIPNIYLARLQLAQVLQNAQIQIGFYALCVKNTNDSNSLKCMSTYGVSADSLTEALMKQENNQNVSTIDPAGTNSTASTITSYHGLINIALDLQRNILVSPLVAGGVLFLIAVISLSLTKMNQRNQFDPEKQERSRRRLSWLVSMTLYLMWMSTMLAFAAALATTEALTGLQYITSSDSGTFLVFAGSTLQVLQWLIFGLSILFAFGVSDILRSQSSSSRTLAGPPAYSAAGPIARAAPAFGQAGLGRPGAGRGPPSSSRGPPVGGSGNGW